MKTFPRTSWCFLAFVLLAGALPADPAVDEEALRLNLQAIRARREAGAATLAPLAAPSAAAIPPIPSDEILKLLRDKGIALTGGYGQATRSAARLTTVQLRYNIFQKDATTYQNRLYADQPRKQVSFGGRNKTYQFANMAAAEGEELTDMSDLTLPRWLSGVYLWAGWTDQEVEFGAEKGKPVLAGLSAGFGPLEKGASTVHLDVGLAFYRNGKMPKDDVYVGLSVDLELFKKLLSAF